MDTLRWKLLEVNKEKDGTNNKNKRSTSTAAPSSAYAGELAYSFDSDNLSVGSANDIIGGNLYIAMLDHTAGTLTAGSAIIDSNSKIDQLLVDNLSLNGNALTSTSGDIVLTAAQNLDLDLTGGTIENSTQATELKVLNVLLLLRLNSFRNN